MGYSYNGTKLKNSGSIAKGTDYSEAVTFKVTDFKDPSGVPYYQGDTYTGHYVKCNSGILSGTWGNIPYAQNFSYNDNGKTKYLPFTSTKSCPRFYYGSNGEAHVSSNTYTHWGNHLVKGPSEEEEEAGTTHKTVYLSYRNEANTSNTSYGIWYSLNGTTWSQGKQGHSLCFVDLVAGGGGGGGCVYYAGGVGGLSGFEMGGGGGGGGGYIRAVLNLEATGKVTITVGAGGKKGVSKTTGPGPAGNGKDSTLKTESGITITCKGGVAGNTDGSSVGGAGGQVTNSLGHYNNTDLLKGLVAIQVYFGKPGGDGVFTGGTGSAGGSFAATDVYSSFGLFKTDKAVLKTGYHGYGGSIYNPFADMETPLGGGGGGASALGGGYCAGLSGSHHGFGGGGNGAACGVKNAFWNPNDECSYNGYGCVGGTGACIISYSYIY